MGHRSSLLTRWSRRDRLAILVVAVTVAFLTGTTLVGLAVGSSTADLAADFDTGATVEWHVGDAPDAPDAVNLPVAEVTVNGTETLAVGVPPNASVAGTPLPGGTTWGTVDDSRNVTLAGSAGDARLAVSPRGRSPFPDRWVVVDPAVVDRLGQDATLTATPADGVPETGVPLRSVLAFFLAGTREVLAALAVAGVLGATLAGVTVFATTRTTVRDRADTIAVLRATGATPRAVASLFTGRALLQTVVGVALGYATGVILTNVVVNVAVTAGVPTSLDVAVSARSARYLLGLYGLVVALALVAALAAVRPAVSRPPASVGDPPSRASLPGPLAPDVLDARAVIPTAATLAAFVAFVLLVAGVGSVAAPLAATDATTVTEPGSTHPIASNVPAGYADALRARGIPASAEILLFEVRDGQPFPARGANYSAFASLTGADLARGRTPTDSDEAVVGAGLARTLSVDVGDRVLLGGSTQQAVTRVEVVGVFDASGSTDDQLVVPLDTARHLSATRRGGAQFIRAARLPEPDASDTVAVSAVTAPDTVVAGSEFTVRVDFRNAGLVEQRVTRTVRFRGASREVTVTAPATGETTATVTFRAPDVDNSETYRVTVGNVSRQVEVVPPNVIRVVGLPERAPPGSEPRLRVVTATGTPVVGANMTVGDRTVRTNGEGYARVRLDDPGDRSVVVRKGNRTTRTGVTVAADARRTLAVTTTLSPATPTLFTRPEFRVRIANPWNRTLARTVRVEAPGGPYERAVRLGPGATRTLRWTLPRQSPGGYDVTTTVDGDTRANLSYRVTGDERVIAALATGGRQGTTGIGRAAQVAFGNLGLALGALVVLGGLMAVGGTGATFAAAVHARRHTLGVNRAVGAPPTWVLRTVLVDALRLGVVAVVPALALGVGILAVADAAGLLVVYGVQVPVVPSVPVLLASAGGALVVTLLGAGVAALGIARGAPARVLGDETPDVTRGGTRE